MQDANRIDYHQFLAESLEELYENATCGYLSTLLDGTVVKLNQTLLGWLGYQRQEVVQVKTFAKLLTIGGKLFYETHLSPMLQMQGFFREISLELHQRQGGNLPMLVDARQVKDATGTPVLNRFTLVNITNRRHYEHELLWAKRKAEQMSQALATAHSELKAAHAAVVTSSEEIRVTNEELAQANQQLSRLNADLDTFVYMASHDLKAPILNIEGLLKVLERELAKQQPQVGKVQQIYRLLYGSVDRFKETIQDLTQVAQIGKEVQQDVTHVSVRQVLEEVQLDLAPQIQEAEAQLEIQLDCPQVRFSRKNLKSILYNLLSNAVKYRSPERQLVIQLTCQQEDGYTVLSVLDNGLGIDMKQEGKIFALFKRLHSHVEGTGMGLYIVKKILENAGGKIQVESQVGVGSTFRLYFKQ